MFHLYTNLCFLTHLFFSCLFSFSIVCIAIFFSLFFFVYVCTYILQKIHVHHNFVVFFLISHLKKLQKAGHGCSFPVMLVLNFRLFNSVNNIWSIQDHVKSIATIWRPLALVFRVHLIKVVFWDDCITQI